MLLFYFFASVIIFLGYKSLRGGFDFLSYFKRELAKTPSNFTPFCSIIAPCRGIDEDLAQNLSALFAQDFPAYEILFVIDDEKDESGKIIEKLVSASACRRVSASLIVAGKAQNEGQKVHNLREAVLHIAPESEIFVFVDSDARPNKDWLRNLIAPLEDEKIGCTSGYRWFIAKNPFSLAAQFRAVWNASIASQLGANVNKNFCWGGATAISRRTFEKLAIREKWRGTLSDDFTLTRTMNEAKLPIYFVPQCLTATVEDCSFAELREFTTRQMKITRVYAPHLWKASLIGSLLFSVVFWTNVALLFFVKGWQFWICLTFLAVIFALGTGKAWFRLKAVELVLKNYEKQLNQSYLWHLAGWQFAPLLYFYNSMSAWISRKIIWRGITYKLKSPTETIIIAENK